MLLRGHSQSKTSRLRTFRGSASGWSSKYLFTKTVGVWAARPSASGHQIGDSNPCCVMSAAFWEQNTNGVSQQSTHKCMRPAQACCFAKKYPTACCQRYFWKINLQSTQCEINYQTYMNAYNIFTYIFRKSEIAYRRKTRQENTKTSSMLESSVNPQLKNRATWFRNKMYITKLLWDIQCEIYEVAPSPDDSDFFTSQ